MTPLQDEIYGKLLLSDLFTNIWFGNWDKYEQTIEHVSQEITQALPFHPFYERKKTNLMYENYFSIPGDHFIPPYVSAYAKKSENAQQQARQDLLCLIGAYEKVGYYYPLENEEFPDHIGSITGFITALINEEIKALEENNIELVKKIEALQQEVFSDYLQPVINDINKQFHKKADDQFFKEFIPFYTETMEMIIFS